MQTNSKGVSGGAGGNMGESQNRILPPFYILSKSVDVEVFIQQGL